MVHVLANILRSKRYNRRRKATEKDDDQETLEKEILIGKCGQWASGSAGGRWRRQRKRELGGDEWSVANDTLAVRKYKSSSLTPQVVSSAMGTRA